MSKVLQVQGTAKNSHQAEQQARAAVIEWDGQPMNYRGIAEACEAEVEITGTLDEVVNAARWFSDILGLKVVVMAWRENADYTQFRRVIAVFPSDAEMGEAA